MKKSILCLVLFSFFAPFFAQQVDSIIDIRDSKVYKVVKIGDHWWLQDNLNIGIYVESINTGAIHSESSSNGIIEKYCFDNDPTNCDLYGGLYSWREIWDYTGSIRITKGICPSDWHMPTKIEMTSLIEYLGGTSIAGGKLKDTSSVFWHDPNSGATNESGFSALPGSYRDEYGAFGMAEIGKYAHFWTETKYSTYQAWSMINSFDNSEASFMIERYDNGNSVRCARDSANFKYLTLTDKNLNTLSGIEILEYNLTDTFYLYNMSAEISLTISSITNQTSVFTPVLSSTTISPGDSALLIISLNETSPAYPYHDTLSLGTNDPYKPDISIPLYGLIRTDTIVDVRDGQQYPVVLIDQDWWMQKNLNYGTRIDRHQNAGNNSITEKYCYDDNDSLCDVYGGLYQWDEAVNYYKSPYSICPVNWYIPNLTKYWDLQDFLGGSSYAGEKMMESGTSHWNPPNTWATNESGFTALPAGYRSWITGNYYDMGSKASIWTSSYYNTNTSKAWYAYLNDYGSFGTTSEYKKGGLSVRCYSTNSSFSYLAVSTVDFKSVDNLTIYGSGNSESFALINSSIKDEITIKSIEIDDPSFSVDQTTLTIPPMDTVHIRLTFTNPVKDIYPAWVTIISDDPWDTLNSFPVIGTFPPEIEFSNIRNVTCFGGNNGSVTCNPSLGAPPWRVILNSSYSWDTTTFNSLYADSYYYCYLTDNNGWGTMDSIKLSQPGQLLTPVTDSTNISCFGYSDGMATIAPSGGNPPYTISWDDPSGTTSVTVNNLLADVYYHVEIVDDSGCVHMDSVMLLQPAPLISSISDSGNISCFGFSDGWAELIVIGGTRPYAYSWDNLATTKDSLAPGLEANKYYHVNVIDSLNCSLADSVILSQPEPLLVQITDSTNITCHNIPDGTAKAFASGGTKPYYFTWNDKENTVDSTVSGLAADIYSIVSLTDSNSCPPVRDSIMLTQPPTLVIDFPASTNISCFGLSDGMATALPSGGIPPYYYQWDDSGNSTDSIVVGLSANVYYRLVLTDAHDCSISDSIMLSQPDQLLINPIYSDTICLHSNNGYISTNLTGGTEPFSYLWSNGMTSENITELGAGDYSILITDSHGCNDSMSFTINSAVPIEERICIVTIDLTEGKYLVVWEKTLNRGIAFYNIYREDNLIGTVPYSDLSIFKDSIADPEKRPYLYQLSVIDTCGNESALSHYHKPHFLQYVSSEGGVILSWDEYVVEGETVDFGSYAVYRGSDSTALAPLEEDIPIVINVYTDNDVQALRKKYFYRVAGNLINPCYPSSDKKADSGPYSHAFSNVEENRLQNKPPENITIDSDTISENQTALTLIGRFSTVDPDTADSHTYKLVNGDGATDNGSFKIDGDLLLSNMQFDYETQSNFSIRVQCKDNGVDSLTYEKVFIITINDLKEVGFEDVYATNLKIYPNPFNESATLQFNNPERESYRLYIVDLSGKVYRIVEDITSSEYVFKKGDLEKGMYFVELVGPRIFRGKIVIE